MTARRAVCHNAASNMLIDCPRRLAPLRLLLPLVLCLALAACGQGGPLLRSADLSASRVDAGGDGSPVTLQYALARPGSVSLAIIGPDGARYLLRQDERRPAGEYQLALDGTYPLPDDPEQRRTLPDGDYTVEVRASGADGGQAETRPLRVEHADRTPPAIEHLAVYPAAISPNFDGVDDVARISYRLQKPSRVYAFVQAPDGTRLPLGPRAYVASGEYALEWDGTRADTPVPDGDYQV